MREIIAYIRSSCGHPLLADEQVTLIRRYATQHGLPVGRIVAERPGRRLVMLDHVINRLANGDGGTLVIASLCRLAPTLPGLLRVLSRLRDADVRVLIASPDEAETTSAAALIASLDAIQAARRSMHAEATALGRMRARARGVRFGRPRTPEHKIQKVELALSEGAGIRAAARRAGVSPATVLRISRGVGATCLPIAAE